MKNKKLIAAAAAICVVVLIVVLAIGQSTKKPDHADLSNEATTAGSKEGTDAPKPAADTGSDEENPAMEGALAGTEGKAGKNGAADAGPESGVVTLPYTIPNTSLTIQKIAGYDGIFLEDGSDSSVSGICSIVLKNTGSMDVEFARITLSCNGTPLTFELSDLPSGAVVVAQEINQTAYQDGVYRDCSADIAEIDGLEQSAGQISVRENGDGSLTVTNITDKRIPCVRVFYKFYMSDEDIYVGGITYTAKLTDLEAEGSYTIIPSHYSLGYSKVVMIRTYDSKE